MFWILILIPAATLLTTFLLYKQVGKRDFLKLDIVQFLYAFVFSPLVFVWLKSFLLYMAKNELDLRLSQNQLFLLDTGFSLIFLYFYAFVVIHSLTKTYEVKLQRDPLFDILAHAEEFHLWISHTSMYFLSGLLLTLLGLTNLWVPLSLELSPLSMYGVMTLGLAMGWIGFSAIWLSNFTAGKFLRIIKLFFGIDLTALILGYFWFSPTFSGTFALYWFMLMIFSGVIMASQVVKRSAKSRQFIGRFHHKHGAGWSENNFLLLVDSLRPKK